MPPLRFESTERIMGATAFSKDDSVQGAVAVIKLLKSQKHLWKQLQEACDLDAHWGRRRLQGNWELVAVGFVASDSLDIQPWHANTTLDFWRLCGFKTKPTYRTTWRRLRELEHACDAFLTSVGALVQKARKHDPAVGAHVRVDGTEDETHAALKHDCQGNEGCPYREGHASGKGRAGAGERPKRVPTSEFREQRQKLNEEAPIERVSDDPSQPEKVQFVRIGSRMYKRVKIRGCWYRTLDLDAGIRAYMGPRGAKRFWHGYYNQKVKDNRTGGVLFPGVYNASYQEYDLFEDVYDNVARIIGAPPESVTGDKGFSVESVFKKCTTNGTAPVFSWRPGGGDLKRHDKETHDRHGIPRCKHCGGPSAFVRFSVGDRARPAEERNPRLWFLCMLGSTPACAREQTIACSSDWRLLVPLWRTEALYHELKEGLSPSEAVHDWWRDRYKVAADTLALRPKVRSIGWHRLRANVGCLIEWLRICFREGWLGGRRRHEGKLVRKYEKRGKRAARLLAGYRLKQGLGAAYGDKAVELELGDRVPPSRRPRGAPPGQKLLDIPAK